MKRTTDIILYCKRCKKFNAECIVCRATDVTCAMYDSDEKERAIYSGVYSLASQEIGGLPKYLFTEGLLVQHVDLMSDREREDMEIASCTRIM